MGGKVNMRRDFSYTLSPREGVAPTSKDVGLRQPKNVLSLEKQEVASPLLNINLNVSPGKVYHCEIRYSQGRHCWSDKKTPLGVFFVLLAYKLASANYLRRAER